MVQDFVHQQYDWMSRDRVGRNLLRVPTAEKLTIIFLINEKTLAINLANGAVFKNMPVYWLVKDPYN